MTNLIPFEFESKSVRVVAIDGSDPLFVAKDVAKTLGYANPADAISKHCRRPKYLKDTAIAIRDQQNQELIAGLHGESVLIPEPDVYRLVMRSQLESAERFQDWVCEEVLPAIRKTGGFGNTQPSHSADNLQQAYKLTPIAARAAKAFGFKGNHAALCADNAVRAATGVSVLAAMGQAALPAAEQEPLLIVSEIADRLGCGVREVNPLLIRHGLQTEYRDHKDRLHYELTDAGQAFGVYVDTAKKHQDGTPVRQIKWRAAVVDVLSNQEVAA